MAYTTIISNFAPNITKGKEAMNMSTNHNNTAHTEADERYIRPVSLADAAAITKIYNHYIKETTITFEIEPITVEEMASRIKEISAQFPYFVYEQDGKILGYCYAHLWKQRAAYSKTLETTIYLDKNATHQGLGSLMVKHLIQLCKAQGYHALIACITEGNEASVQMHEHLGFKQVSEFKEVGEKFGRWLGVVDLEYIL